LFKRLKRRMYLRKFKGDKFICPLCGIKLKNFVPLPERFKTNLTINNVQYNAYDCETLNVDNYICPNCGAADRERLYAAYFKMIANKIKPDSSLIHFAPENALSKHLKKQNIYKYSTADLCMKNVDFKVDLTKMDVFLDNSFDIFICSHMLEHIENDILALKELYRILKPGGWGILMVPILTPIKISYEDPNKTAPEERKIFFGQEDHVRVYAKQDFINKVKSIGFSLKEFKNKNFEAGLFEQYGITPQSVLYIVEKS
jgi:predicted SAM-dependent methyltransferase/rubredoxin